MGEEGCSRYKCMWTRWEMRSDVDNASELDDVVYVGDKLLQYR